MHADFQELLSLRDGGPVAADTAQHVPHCPECSLELARLRRLRHHLHQLPQFEPPHDTWLNISEQLDRLPSERRRRRWIYRSGAVAAGILVTLTALLWSVSSDHGRVDPASGKESIGQLVTRSQQLEAMLQSLPQRPAVQRAETSATIDELQTRIQMLDLQLSNVKSDPDRAQARRLWSTRNQLLDSLVYVRFAEASRDGYSPVGSIDSGVI
jgi:hypothetical protein